jgi:hypothetical protein
MTRVLVVTVMAVGVVVMRWWRHVGMCPVVVAQGTRVMSTRWTVVVIVIRVMMVRRRRRRQVVRWMVRVMLTGARWWRHVMGIVMMPM